MASCSFSLRRAGCSALAAQRRAFATSSGPESADIRSQLLEKAVQLVPEHGFSLRTLQEAAASVPSLQRFATSSLAIDQLFPSAPPRIMRNVRTDIKGKGPEIPELEADAGVERLGPRKALFEAWAEKQRQALHDLDFRKGPQGIRDALQARLGMNLPVLPFLPNALTSLSARDPSQGSLPTLQNYLAHVRNIAYDIKDLTKAETSLLRVASVYSLSEIYQISKAHPTLDQTMRYADELLERTSAYDGLLKDTWEFGGYVFKSWKSIINARGM